MTYVLWEGMARHIWQLKLTELHGQATQIAQEIKIIETSFGAHCVSKLLPLVVGVLERLEQYVDEYEKLQTENAKLSLKLSGQDCSDSTASGLDNYVIVVTRSDPELGSRTLDRARPNIAPATPTARRSLPAPPTPTAAEPATSTFSLNSPEAPTTPLSGAQTTTQFTYAVDAPSIEQQLQKAREELAAAQTAMVQLQNENQQLKEKINQLSASTAEFEQQVSTTQHYKQDLLSVLIEKTALREDMIAVQEELDVTKRQLKECISRLSLQQQQLDTLDT